ncbi:MAG TPA: bifunctional molybdenum cofactor biosynthesis protein MoaC/MoaB [Candidatus Nitrosocosmicus sp.]|nr:bifunctional molybdenum cofactor biosynthesis protein MoaC/MoaB [Candidatus Nitrosocosmicus sp.]
MGMIDVSEKPDSSRTATAQALIYVSPKTMERVKDGNSPKGNLFEAAKISATIAVKKTFELIPYCHSIPIDAISVEFAVEKDFIKIAVGVKTVWKTGVEMEALTGASIGALTMYDMLKPIDENLKIESIKVLEKKGGIKNLYLKKDGKKLFAVVIVISDTRNTETDQSGKIIINTLKEKGFEIVDYKVIPDNQKTIEEELKSYCNRSNIDIILTSGGTGIGPHDVTPEATKNIIEREIDGIEETLRNYGQQRTPTSMLSRQVAGIIGNTIIINLPGSTDAVTQSLCVLFPGILHAFKMISGHGHE